MTTPDYVSYSILTALSVVLVATRPLKAFLSPAVALNYNYIFGLRFCYRYACLSVRFQAFTAGFIQKIYRGFQGDAQIELIVHRRGDKMKLSTFLFATL